MPAISFPSSLSCIRRYALAFIANRTASFIRVRRYLLNLAAAIYRFFAYRVSPFWIQLSCFVTLAFSGSLALMLLNPSNPAFSPRYVDMFYLSTSALTVSGLATVRMEDLSSSQVVVYTLLMLLGGEVFVSLLGLLMRRLEFKESTAINNIIVDIEFDSTDHQDADIDRIESGVSGISKELKYNSIRYLGYVVMCYHLFFHVVGTIFILSYVTIIQSAKDVLKRKGIHASLFSISLAVSSFANGGLVPTNENMIIFKENSGLLLAVVGLVLVGNTLFPMMLKLVIWGLAKVTRRVELEHMMKNPRDMGFPKLLPRMKAAMVSLTVIGLVAIQVSLFCSMDWGSAAVFDGLSPYQKVVNALFMAVNTRHAGEGSVDLSTVSAAVNVLFMVMMFLPSSTSFAPITVDYEESTARKEKKKERCRAQDVILSPLPMIVLFVIAICITERRRISKDPVNFSVFNLVFEVVSAYGNVGFSIGYGCSRRLDSNNGSCVDQPYSFSGWWSDRGKVILTVIMLYGRLKKYTMVNGNAWRL